MSIKSGYNTEDMSKVNVAGLQIDAITKTAFLGQLKERLLRGQKTWVITPYSEFLFHALQSRKLMDIYNQADFSLADGIGIFWAKKYLELPLSAKNYWLKIFQSAWQIAYSLASIIFYPSWIKRALPEKIVGADLIWDLAALAEKNNLSVYLFGGASDTPKLAAEKLTAKFPKLKIAGYSNKNIADPTIIEDIKTASPDLLFAGLKAIEQELWLASVKEKLPCKLLIGLGGSFDYLAGKRPIPPKFLRSMGLEWLWRLFTQKNRLKRIINATWGLASALWHYKVFDTYGLRPNVVIVLLNRQNQVMICQRNPKDFRVDLIGEAFAFDHENYWQFPQGGIDQNENLIDAAARELMEETGITAVEYLYTSPHQNIYFWNDSGRKFWVNKHFLYKGQKQNVVYFKFLGNEADIDFPDKRELLTHRFIPANMIEKELAAERKNLARLAMADLKEMAEKGIIDIDKIDQN